VSFEVVQDILNDTEEGLGVFVEDKDRMLIKSVTKHISERSTTRNFDGGSSAPSLENSGDDLSNRYSTIMTEDLRRLVELTADRREAEAKARCARVDIVIGAVVTFVLLMVGALCFPAIEGWAYDNSFYFGVVTMTTIGLGDMYPETHAGLWFWYIWCALGLGSMSVVMNGLASLSSHSHHVRMAVQKSWDVADWSIQAAEVAILTSMHQLERNLSRSMSRTLSVGKLVAAEAVGAIRGSYTPREQHAHDSSSHNREGDDCAAADTSDLLEDEPSASVPEEGEAFSPQAGQHFRFVQP